MGPTSAPGRAGHDRSWARARARRIVFGFLVGVPLSALFLWLAVRALDFERVLAALRRADPVRVGLALAAMAAVYAVQAARWRWIARHDVRLPFRRFLEFVTAGIACNNVVPGRPGEFLRAYLLAGASGVSRSRALGTVVVDRVSDVLALTAALAVSYAFLPHPPWLERLNAVVVPLSVLIVAALGSVWWYARRPARASGGALLARRPSRVRLAVSEILDGVGRTLNWKDGTVVLALSALGWCIWGVAAWLVSSSLGIHLSLLETVFVTALLNLGTAIPSSPGFIGTYQWLSVTGLGLLAVGQAEAFAFSVLMQAVWFVTSSAGGLGFLVRRSLAEEHLVPARRRKTIGAAGFGWCEEPPSLLPVSNHKS